MNLINKKKVYYQKIQKNQKWILSHQQKPILKVFLQKLIFHFEVKNKVVKKMFYKLVNLKKKKVLKIYILYYNKSKVFIINSLKKKKKLSKRQKNLIT